MSRRFFEKLFNIHIEKWGNHYFIVKGRWFKSYLYLNSNREARWYRRSHADAFNSIDDARRTWDRTFKRKKPEEIIPIYED